jgi:hypothetical protein
VRQTADLGLYLQNAEGAVTLRLEATRVLGPRDVRRRGGGAEERPARRKC